MAEQEHSERASNGVRLEEEEEEEVEVALSPGIETVEQVGVDQLNLVPSPFLTPATGS